MITKINFWLNAYLSFIPDTALIVKLTFHLFRENVIDSNVVFGNGNIYLRDTWGISPAATSNESSAKEVLSSLEAANLRT